MTAAACGIVEVNPPRRSIKQCEKCGLKVRARIDLSGIQGRALRYNRDTPGEAEPCCEGSLAYRFHIASLRAYNVGE
jgi:hypothetical protein